jgi:hypothetical protein
MTTNTARLKTFVDLMNEGKFDEARAMVSEKVVVREPQAIPYGGDHEGLDGFDTFRSIFAKTWKRWVDGPFWYAEADNTVVKYNTITATSRATGRQYTTRLVELFTFEDGLIVEAVIFYQDVPEFLAAIRPDAAE